MTYYLLLLSIFVWPFGQLLAFQVETIPTTIYLLDICLGLTTISLLLSAKYRKKISADFLFKPLCIFLSIASLSLLINVHNLSWENLLVSLLYLARLFVYPSVYFAIKFTPFKRLKIPLLVSFTIFCILGVAQYIFLPDMRFLKQIGFDDHYYRLIGSFYDPNFTGAILAGAALFMVALSQWIVAIPLIIMLAVTFSRASYLIFALGLVFILLQQKKIVYLSLLLILAIVIVIIPKPFGEGVNLYRTFSIFSRFDSWNNGINLFLQKPVFGWGYNTLRSLRGERFQIDNSYIYIAATTGILGLTSFLYLLYKSIKNINRLPEKVFFLSIILHSFFNNSLFYIWIFFVSWVVLGFATREYKQS